MSHCRVQNRQDAPGAYPPTAVMDFYPNSAAKQKKTRIRAVLISQ